MRRITFAFRVFGMSPTKMISRGASALPRSHETLSFNSAARVLSPFASFFKTQKQTNANKCDLLDSYCERCGRRYGARGDGFFASRHRRKCAHSNRVAASAVSFSSLRRQLSRSHKHRVCDARDERRSRSDRFGLWHGERNFLCRLFCAANSRRAIGRALEREVATRDHIDYVGRINNSDRFCPHSAAALRRAFLARRGRGGVLSRSHCLSFSLVHLSGPSQSRGAVYVRHSDWLYHRWADCWRNPGCPLAWPFRLAVAFLAGRRARDLTWNRDTVRTAGSA